MPEEYHPSLFHRVYKARMRLDAVANLNSLIQRQLSKCNVCMGFAGYPELVG